MPSINMIAPRRAEKKRLERDMRRLAVVILAELVFVVCLGGFVCTKLWSTRCRITDLEVQITKLQPQVKEIERNEAATAKLLPKLDLLNQAKSRTMRWYTSLDKLTQSLPESTYLTRMTTARGTPDNPAVKVFLNGISPSQAKVGEVMLRLQTIPDFEEISLHFTQKGAVSTLSNVNVVEFEIGAAMKQDAPAQGGVANGSGQS